MADKHLYLVFNNPIPGREDEFAKWYDGTHIPQVMAVDGKQIVSAQRYKLRQLSRDAGQQPAQACLTVYELEGDPDEYMDKIVTAVSAGEVQMEGAPFDIHTVAMSFWEPVTEKVEQPE